MSLARVRVELRDVPGNSSYQDRQFAFTKMFSVFKKKCAEAGILHQYKQHEFYESTGEKNRRKKRESESMQLKAKMRESFPERGKKKKDK